MSSFRPALPFFKGLANNFPAWYYIPMRLLLAAIFLFAATAVAEAGSIYALWQHTINDDIGRGSLGLEIDAKELLGLKMIGEIGSQISDDPALDYRAEATFAPFPLPLYAGAGLLQVENYYPDDPALETEYVVAGGRVTFDVFFGDGAARYQFNEKRWGHAWEAGLADEKSVYSLRYEHIVPGVDRIGLRVGFKF